MLDKDEIKLLNKLLELYRTEAIKRQFVLREFPGEPGTFYAIDEAQSTRGGTVYTFQGSIDSLVNHEFLTRSKNDAYYLTSNALSFRQNHNTLNTVVDLVALTDLIEEYFSMDEVNDLCFRLSVKYENIPGNTLYQKSRELVKLMHRNGRIHDLTNIIRRKRPAMNKELSNLIRHQA